MISTHALWMRFEASRGNELDVERLLFDRRRVVAHEGRTECWLLGRLGRGEFGVFATFPDRWSLERHLDDHPSEGLEQYGHLLAGPPRLDRAEVLAEKVVPVTRATKALLLRLPIAAEHHTDMEAVLLAGRATVAEDEPHTVAWYALRLEHDEFAEFSVFPDLAARRAHVTGRFAGRVAAHVPLWLNGLPHTSVADVVAEQWGTCTEHLTGERQAAINRELDPPA